MKQFNMLPLLIILNALYTVIFSASFSCTNYYSAEDTVGSLVSVGCGGSSDEVLTSCGYMATNTSRINRRGAQLSNICKTLSEDSNGPVAGATAIARCCTYPVRHIACG